MNVQRKIQLLKTDFLKLYPLNFSKQLIATNFSGNAKFCTEAFKLITIWIHRLPLILIFEISIRCNKARTVIPSTFQQHKRYVVTAGCCSRVTCPVEIVCFRENQLLALVNSYSLAHKRSILHLSNGDTAKFNLHLDK